MSRLYLAIAIIVIGVSFFSVWSYLPATPTTSDRRFSGILFGHSFVSRFGDHLNTIRGDEQRSNQDLLQLNNLVDSLEVIGRSGAELDYFENFCKKMKEESFGAIDFLVVDMGSNDLDNKMDPKDLVERMVQLGHELVGKHIVQSIVFLQVAARARSHNAKFAEDRQIFNDHLVKLVQHNPGLRYQKMTNYSEENLKTWSNDSIHADTEIGRKMYFHTIQQAISAAIETCSLPWSSSA